MFSVSCLCIMATGLLCNSMLPVASFLYFCMFVNIYANRKKIFDEGERKKTSNYHYHSGNTALLCRTFLNKGSEHLFWNSSLMRSIYS